MAAPSINYIRQRREELRYALEQRNANQVADFLALPAVVTGVVDENKFNQYKATLNNSNLEVVENTGNNGTSVDWSMVLKNWLLASYAATLGDVEKCFEYQSNLHSAVNLVFGSSAGNWLVPALHTVCKATHAVAIQADESMGNTSDWVKLQSAVTLLQESFSKALNDRTEYKPNAPLDEEGSKKAGVLLIVNQLFSMYFRLNTLRLCKNLLRPVESRNLHEEGTMGQKVTYRYYVGRLNMFEDKYEEAEKNLDYALSHCYKDSLRNKKRILNYLLPVKLLRGRLPTGFLLEKYKMYEFWPLVEGIRTGNLRVFNEGLMKSQELFIRRGTYLLLEKCKMICYRTLFKRIHLVLGRHQVLLQHIAKILKWLDTPMDLDEIECILANLIYRGYVRGYISHTKRVLVLSKKDPFPFASIAAK